MLQPVRRSWLTRLLHCVPPPAQIHVPASACIVSPKSARRPTAAAPTEKPTSSIPPKYKMAHTPPENPATAAPEHTNTSPPPKAHRSQSLSATPTAPEPCDKAVSNRPGRTAEYWRRPHRTSKIHKRPD